MLKLYTPEQISDFEIVRTYRSNTWTGLLAITVISFALTLFVAMPKGQPVSPVLVVMPGMLTLLFFALFIAHWRMCHKQGNWLVKECAGGLLINLRTFRNYHLPADSHRILFVPSAQIAGIGKTLEQRNLPHAWLKEKSQFAHLDLYLREGVQMQELKAALHRERRCENPESWRKRYADSPVQVPEPGVIRLVWDWIHPREDKALDVLGETYGVAPERKVYSSDWDGLSDKEKDALIDRLWEQGHEERAYMLAAQHYSMREKKARQMVLDRNLQRPWQG